MNLKIFSVPIQQFFLSVPGNVYDCTRTHAHTRTLMHTHTEVHVKSKISVEQPTRTKLQELF